jgi:hypothetical protein
MARGRKDPDLKGRSAKDKSDRITNIKKGSRMPARKGKEAMKPFFVAEGVRMGHPNMDLTQADAMSVRTAEQGDKVMLTKAQAEWCLANGFIDSLLPDFETDSTADTAGAEDAEAEEGDGSAADGQGELPLDGGSAESEVQKTAKPAPRRKAAQL